MHAEMSMQVALYNRGLQLDSLRVLSTTTTVPTASSGTCSQGAINGICIGAPLMRALNAQESACGRAAVLVLHCHASSRLASACLNAPWRSQPLLL